MRKFLVIGLILLCAMTAAGQKIKVEVDGKATPSSKTVSVFNENTKKPVTSIPVNADGTFNFKGSLPKNTYLRFIDDKARKANFIIVEETDKAIWLDIPQDKAGGAPLNEELYNVCAQYYKKRKDPKSAQNYLLKKIQDNKDNCVPAFWISANAEAIGYEKLKELLNSGDFYTTQPLAAYAQRTLQAMEEEHRLIGSPLKDFKQPDADGTKHSIKEYVGHGNYVLIDFWASWCGPCMAEMPVVKDCYEKYKSQGFNVVGISLDNNLQRWQKAIADKGLTWPQLSDLRGWQNAAAAVYDIHAIPYSLLCDGNGNIVAVNLRGNRLKEKLAEIYGEK